MAGKGFSDGFVEKIVRRSKNFFNKLITKGKKFLRKSSSKRPPSQKAPQRPKATQEAGKTQPPPEHDTDLFVSTQKIFTRQNKSKKTKTNSATRVNFPQSVLTGERKTFGFKCDSGLAEAFKPVAKHYFGSICRPLECFMLAVLALQKEEVNFGRTVRIEKMNILRNLRPRRKLEFEVCGFADCEEPPVGRGVWLKRDEEYLLCEKHLAQAKKDPRNWKVTADDNEKDLQSDE